MDVAPFLAQLRAQADPARVPEMARYHKIDRTYLGLSNPQLNDITKRWRRELDVADRVAVAEGLWATNIYEGRLAAAKLLTQARIRPDEAAWALILSWAPDFDSWAIADHACMAGQKRLVADPDRLDAVEAWTMSKHMWTKRAALVISLPWAKQNNPKPHELAARERILGWAESYVPDQEWFIQKAIAWWLRDLSKRAPDRVRQFLEKNGAGMKPFARKEASKYL